MDSKYLAALLDAENAEKEANIYCHMADAVAVIEPGTCLTTYPVSSQCQSTPNSAVPLPECLPSSSQSTLADMTPSGLNCVPLKVYLHSDSMTCVCDLSRKQSLCSCTSIKDLEMR